MFRTMYRWLRAVLFILFSCSIGHSFLKNALFKSYPFHTVTPSEFIRVLSVRGVTDCGCSCMRSQRCVSFNFALEANAEGKYVCQLLPTDQAHHGLTATPFFHHYELVPTVSSMLIVLVVLISSVAWPAVSIVVSTLFPIKGIKCGVV